MAAPPTEDARRRILTDLTAAAEAATRANATVDALIVDARVAGASLREIAAAGSLNHQTIANRLAAAHTKEKP